MSLTMSEVLKMVEIKNKQNVHLADRTFNVVQTSTNMLIGTDLLPSCLSIYYDSKLAQKITMSWFMKGESKVL